MKVTTTTTIEDGANSNHLDFTLGNDPQLPAFIMSCCSRPETSDGDGSSVRTDLAWVDASGQPGFHRPEATAVPSFGFARVEVDDAGIAVLDPCAIAPDFGCQALPAGHTARWLFGDGNQTGELSGFLSTQRHKYPPDTLDFLGMLVVFDENGEMIHTARFTPHRGGRPPPIP